MSSTAADIAEHRAWLCSLVATGAVGTLLDVGCGRGDDLRAIAAHVKRPDARLVGLDASTQALAQATGTEAGMGAGTGDARLTFQAYHVTSTLPFPDAAFDVVFSNNFLECIGDQSALLHEVARVLRPGGQVVCAHWDWDTQTFDGADKELVRRAVHAFADWQQPWMEHCDGWMGRRLWSTFQASGLFAGSVHTRVLTNTTYAAPFYGHARIADLALLVQRGLMAQADHKRLLRQVEELAAADRYFYSITCYAYVGRKRGEAL